MEKEFCKAKVEGANEPECFDNCSVFGVHHRMLHIPVLETEMANFSFNFFMELEADYWASLNDNEEDNGPVNWEVYKTVNDECIICHEVGEVVTLNCHSTHRFHSNCLDSWFEHCKRQKCPLCKKCVK